MVPTPTTSPMDPETLTLAPSLSSPPSTTPPRIFIDPSVLPPLRTRPIMVPSPTAWPTEEPTEKTMPATEVVAPTEEPTEMTMPTPELMVAPDSFKSDPLLRPSPWNVGDGFIRPPVSEPVSVNRPPFSLPPIFRNDDSPVTELHTLPSSRAATETMSTSLLVLSIALVLSFFLWM